MTNRNKDRGTRWESAVCAFLRAAGHREVFRMADGGEFDAGDVGGLPGWALECRDRAKIDLAGNVRDAEQRAVHKNVPFAAAVIKKRNAPVADAYVCMSLVMFTEILDEMANAKEAPSR